MSIDTERPSAQRKSTVRVRPTKLVLPADPADEELARDWTLSEADMAEVRHCRGDTNRRRFALQLCTLRNYGRFLDDYELIPVRILTHLSRQLDLPPVLFITARIAMPLSANTSSAYAIILATSSSTKPFKSVSRAGWRRGPPKDPCRKICLAAQ